MSPPHTSSRERLQALHRDGAPALDPLGWHYLQTLAARSAAQTGTVQTLLERKLQEALDAFEARCQTRPTPTLCEPPQPSPLAQLLQALRHSPDPTATATSAVVAAQGASPRGLPPENPRVRQFRRQLRKISVQKQVRQAMDQAPPNAGPINSHRLVLRALGLMRDLSPDYLERFMAYLDTLLLLQEAEHKRLTPRKTLTTVKSRR